MISKIEGTGPVRTAQQIKRAAKTGPASGTSFAKQLDEAGAASDVVSTSSVSGVLGVQEIDDALAGASKGKLRAIDILDKLEGLRIDLLSGALSREKLQQLSQVVSARRVDVSDPKLAEVLDEIDLRAQVELAKYEQKNG